MKNKKSTIGLMLLLASSLVFTNCTKNKTNTAPAPDTEVASVSEAMNAQMIISDIHEIGGQICEANAFLLPYTDGTPLTVTMGTTTVNSNNIVAINGAFDYTVTFNNTVGRDGHVRNGVLVFDYSATPATVPNKYYRIPEFTFNVTSYGYSVDDYTVSINSMTIKNTTPPGFPGTSPFFPSATNMTWSQTADVSIANASGATTFNGTLTKTLLNTNNTPIPIPAGSIPVVASTYTVFGYSGVNNNFLKLEYQYASYSGNGTGTLMDGSSYSLGISSPLTRNMVTSPEKFTSLGNVLLAPEKHPFLTGIMSFKPGSKSERIIDFGAAGDVVDYNVKVTIDGITYDLDIK